ncbi:Ribosome-associated heat shock protein implicated in the recycling of the 50S subunit (S4 paralog) [hydrothermal vent metagenome]|uniref:Ribosome-associated heat shock protein implicated in the recycling of the 50S subunit (S4 paralog) n=1 Tax=hydrothermal vent metagenome TaxID=652676 RepID=A0A3B1DQV3_9ZZZZ
MSNSKDIRSPINAVRIDKWLWAVRICKTRTIATNLCKRQKVFIDGQAVKPSREVHSEQVVIIKREGIQWHYKIIQCIDKRVGASLAAECKENITPQENLERLKIMKSPWTPRREQGRGRPTKKERRELNKLFTTEI